MGAYAFAPLHGYVQIPSDFTFPNRDTPKTRPVLGLNLRRGYLRGVCNTPLHGCTQNLACFRRKSLSQDISGRMQYAPTRVHEKFDGFHISAHGYAKNAPDFTFPDKDTPKTSPILGANLRRRTFRGVCNTPLHGYVKNAPDSTLSNKDTPKTCPILDPNLWRGTFSGRMQYAPTRVRAKPARFHISPSGYAKNAPHFTLPNKDTPKSCPISPFPIRIHPKPTRF